MTTQIKIPAGYRVVNASPTSDDVRRAPAGTILYLGEDAHAWVPDRKVIGMLPAGTLVIRHNNPSSIVSDGWWWEDGRKCPRCDAKHRDVTAERPGMTPSVCTIAIHTSPGIIIVEKDTATIMDPKAMRQQRIDTARHQYPQAWWSEMVADVSASPYGDHIELWKHDQNRIVEFATWMLEVLKEDTPEWAIELTMDYAKGGADPLKVIAACKMTGRRVAPCLPATIIRNTLSVGFLHCLDTLIADLYDDATAAVEAAMEE